tara:strand:+ start:1339 stop:1668 length:330 start_codon:yes stop_codon:yes gene_type:complete
MKKFKLDDMKGGWFVGNFEPSVMKANFEVGIHRHKKGEFHQDHFHKKGIEVNVMRKGKLKLNDEVFEPGDIFILYPYEVSQVEYLTDVELTVVRNISDPDDKYMFDIKK